MSSAAAPTSQQGAVRDHGFHPLRIGRVIAETAEAWSFVLDVPADLRDAYAYAAGQFVTVRVRVDGRTHHRCYSMSSAPAVDGELAVTVKRVPGGVVSNWMIDTLAAGDEVEASVPAGVFTLPPGEGDVVAFGAGSGITPIFSIVKTALATTDRRVRLYYANRDRDAVIFSTAIDALVERYADRLDVVRHYDVDRGFVDGDAVRAFLSPDGGSPGGESADGAGPTPGFFVCGPTPFMDIVEGALLDRGVTADHIHIERFTPAEPAVPAEAEVEVEAAGAGGDGVAVAGEAIVTRVTIELDGRTDTADHHPGATILQTARQLGMSPPYSCESGSCATCMARLVDGTVKMHVNDVLTDDEVDDGWVLTCQSVPTSATVHVAYEEG
jgi:3-ketosteroid 9alpha-monooxygenase subunit B